MPAVALTPNLIVRREHDLQPVAVRLRITRPRFRFAHGKRYGMVPYARSGHPCTRSIGF
jgi:hypothetical protein